jgi:hypothetical protein
MIALCMTLFYLPFVVRVLSSHADFHRRKIIYIIDPNEMNFLQGDKCRKSSDDNDKDDCAISCFKRAKGLNCIYFPNIFPHIFYYTFSHHGNHIFHQFGPQYLVS